MIYTFTANPSIDYHMDLGGGGLIPGQINRSFAEELFPGGKGINVSVVLARLGIESTAWGFTAGRTGAMLEDLLSELGCKCDFIRLSKGETRINVKLDCSMETAVNGKGPQIEEHAVNALLEKAEALTERDILILSGNLQKETGGLYERLAEICRARGARLIADAEGKSLRSTFCHHPFLIKPNLEELLKLFDGEDGSGLTVTELMKKCQREGALNVLVSMGKDGALYLSRDGALYRVRIKACPQAVSTVGAGDSTIAGFLAGMERFGSQTEEVLRFACAAGSATAGRKWLLEKGDAERMLGYISAEAVNDGDGTDRTG